VSDFLTRLAGRARSEMDVVQPRVPSLYEPYRAGGEIGAPRGMYEGLRAPIMPPRAEEPGDNQDAIDLTPEAAPEANRRGTMPYSPPASSREDAAQRPPVLMLPRPDAAQTPPVSSVPRRGAAPAPERDSEDRARRNTHPEERTSSANTGPEARVRRASTAAGAQSGEPSQTPAAAIERQPQMVRRAGTDQKTGMQPVPAQSSFATQSPLSVTATFAQRSADLASTVGPGAAPRRDRRVPSEGAPGSGASVQVSIGRVEVRAVSPPPAERRPAPVRRRPPVSLDDYLNRRHRKP